MFAVLAAGASVHISDPATTASPESLRDGLLDERITHALVMKPMGERLWGLDWPDRTPLRNFRVCGEGVLVWPPTDLPFEIVHLYGSAEAAIIACCSLTDLARRLGADGRRLRLPPLGRPTANVTMYVLSDEGVGVLDNFLELGGESLRAARVAGQGRSALGIDADVHELFERPSIEEMTTAIGAASAA